MKEKTTKTTNKGLSQETPKRKTLTKSKRNPMGTAFLGNMDTFSAQEQKSMKSRAVKPKWDAKTSPRKTENKADSKPIKKTTVIENPKKRISAPRNSKKEIKTQVVKPVEMNKPVKTKKESKKRAQKPVKIIFLGGVGEIGKNMTAFEYGNDIIILDAGLTFPNSEDMPGVDSVVPDVTYLAQNKDKIRGVLLTHGHEDHIGGVPYLMKELNSDTPIFGTRLTLMLTDNKLQEHRIQDTAQRVVKAGDKVKLGAFEVEFINVNHSISGACALAIRTPNGLIYHSGDFKIDLTPVAGEPIDFKRTPPPASGSPCSCKSEDRSARRTHFRPSRAPAPCPCPA